MEDEEEEEGHVEDEEEVEESDGAQGRLLEVALGGSLHAPDHV